ncbi:protein YgfX [Propionivibrio sp.]|uniref:protein YgfX n=1 Tax=Propionivibrio sp. TaxID=2212460 RepID=UPI003450446A
MQFPASIELQRSPLLTLLLVLFHTLAAGSVIALPWDWLLRSVLLLVIGWSLWHSLRPPRILGLRISGRDGLDGRLADGDRVALTALPDSTVFTRLIVLRLRIGEEKRVSSLALLPDQMSAEQFRWLRLWLRWHTEPKKDVGTVF